MSGEFSILYRHKQGVFLHASRAMAHDPTKYSDPDSFNPGRFLTPEGKINDDKTVLTFGFGRRLVRSRFDECDG